MRTIPQDAQEAGRQASYGLEETHIALKKSLVPQPVISGAFSRPLSTTGARGKTTFGTKTSQDVDPAVVEVLQITKREIYNAYHACQW